MAPRLLISPIGMRRWIGSFLSLILSLQMALWLAPSMAAEDDGVRSEPLVIRPGTTEPEPAKPTELVLVEEVVPDPEIVPDKILAGFKHDSIIIRENRRSQKHKPTLIVDVPAEPFTQSQKANWDQMPEKAQIRFQAVRRLALKGLAKALNVTHPTFGAFTVFHDKVAAMLPWGAVFRNSKTVVLNPLAYFRGQKALETLPPRPPRNPRPARERMRDHSDEAMAFAISAVNNFLWERPQVVANFNEGGVIIGLGLQAENGAFGVGKGGVLFPGIRLGYNWAAGVVIVEFFYDIQKYARGAVVNYGTPGKIFPYIAYHELEHKFTVKRTTTKGTAFYPPAPPIPFVGWGFEAADDYIAGAYLCSTIAVPGEFASVLNYQNHMNKKGLCIQVPNPMAKAKQKPEPVEEFRPETTAEYEAYKARKKSSWGKALQELACQRVLGPFR